MSRSRRTSSVFLITSLAALGVLASLTLALPRSAVAATGNVLLLVADDMGIDISTFYRTSVRLRTTPPPPALPNLQALARRGVVFSRAWATPWCSPTRASILTGRYGFRHGLGRPIDQGSPPLALAETTLPEVIGRSGRNYLLRHIGKWHLSEEARGPNLAGWPDYVGPDPSLGGMQNYFRWTKFVNGASSLSTKYVTSDTVDEAIATIEAADRVDRPYFAWVAFNLVHTAYHKPPNNLHTRDSLPATGAPKRAYLEAMVEALDSEVGRLLRSVDFATTTVIFIGDNGTAGGVVAPPYSKDKAKGTIYQGGVQVPLVVAGAGVSGRGYAAGLVNATDLFPTILQLAGIDPAAALPGVRTDGVSLLPYLANPSRGSLRSFAYAEEFGARFDGDWERVIRNVNFALIERFDGSREFYNLVNDRLQNTNLLTRTLTATERLNLAALDSQLDALLATR
jgi:arylsulfatase A-like enzyme